MSGVVEEFDKHFPAIDDEVFTIKECEKLERSRSLKFIGFLQCWIGYVEPLQKQKECWDPLINYIQINSSGEYMGQHCGDVAVQEVKDLRKQLEEAFGLLKNHDPISDDTLTIRLWNMSVEKFLNKHKEVIDEKQK